MKEKKIEVQIQQFENIDELSEIDQNLVEQAYVYAENAYAPFSEFKVGTAILLDNGEIVGGSNQENASFPAGICAERVALSTLSSLWPNAKPIKMAIVVNDINYQSEFACAPCGICRQSINEAENRFEKDIEIIFPGEKGSFYKVRNIQSLLPLSFSAQNLH